MKRIVINEQLILSIALSSLVSYFPIVNCINSITNLFLPEGFIYDTFLMYLILLFVFLYSLFLITKKIKIDTLILLLFIFLSYLFTYLFYEDNRKYMFTNVFDLLNNPIYILFVFGYLGYVFVRQINNFPLFIKVFKYFSYAVINASIITFFIGVLKDSQPQYMVFSYNMLAQTCFMLFLYLKERKAIFLFTGIMGTLLIFFAGARGPIVILILSSLLYYFFRRSNVFNKLLFLVSIVFLLAFGYIFKETLLKILNVISVNLYFDSRTIKLLLSGEFLDLSGRDILLDNIYKNLNIFGHGLYGDRVINGVYSHNLLVEILFEYGLLFGILLFIVILSIVSKALLSKNDDIQLLAFVFLTTGFFKLFLSGSYLNQEPSFFILLAFGITTLQKSVHIRRINLYESSMAV